MYVKKIEKDSEKKQWPYSLMVANNNSRRRWLQKYLLFVFILPPDGRQPAIPGAAIPIITKKLLLTGSVQLRLHRWHFVPDEVLVVAGKFYF